MKLCIPTTTPEPRNALHARGLTVETARDQAQQWLKSTGKFDETAFQLIWSQSDRPILDMVADTLLLVREARELGYDGVFADPQFAVGSPAEMTGAAAQLMAAYRAG